MHTLKSTLVVIMCVVAWLGVGPMRSAADTWPQGSVRFIVPLGPGSAADIGARLVADRLAARWGKPVVVENRPGGDAVIGIAAFVSANDDHSLLFAPSGTFTLQPFVHEKLPYDATRDIVPIARVSNTIVAIASPASLNVASLGELVALARADPGKLNWTGTSIAEFVFAGFVRTSALAMSRVPYRDAQQALADLAEGRIHACHGAGAAADPGRPRQGAGHHQSRTRTDLARGCDGRRSRFPGTHGGRTRRAVRSARHGKRTARAHRRRHRRYRR